MLHLEFNTHGEFSYQIMQYLKEEKFAPMLAVSNEDKSYLILCNVNEDRVKDLDFVLIKLITGADFIKYWMGPSK